MKRLRPIVIALVLASGGLAASVGLAGQHIPVQVGIDFKSRTAWGSLAAARNSPGTTERVSCGLAGYDPVSGFQSLVVMTCSFVDATGQTASCVTGEPTTRAPLAMLNGDSYVMVGWDEKGTCTALLVRNDSAFEPKLP